MGYYNSFPYKKLIIFCLLFLKNLQSLKEENISSISKMKNLKKQIYCWSKNEITANDEGIPQNVCYSFIDEIHMSQAPMQGSAVLVRPDTCWMLPPFDEVILKHTFNKNNYVSYCTVQGLLGMTRVKDYIQVLKSILTKSLPGYHNHWALD